MSSKPVKRYNIILSYFLVKRLTIVAFVVNLIHKFKCQPKYLFPLKITNPGIQIPKKLSMNRKPQDVMPT